MRLAGESIPSNLLTPGALVDKVHAAPTAEGFADVQMPGEPETRHQALRRRGGIPYSRGEVAELQKEAATAGYQNSFVVPKGHLFTGCVLP